MKTDLELQLALAKMLPEKVFIECPYKPGGQNKYYWLDDKRQIDGAVDWERGGGLHVCWLIERGLTDIESQKLKEAVYAMHKAKVRLAYSASWQQRATALIAAKGEK